jgi:hypothetical protein
MQRTLANGRYNYLVWEIVYEWPPRSLLRAPFEPLSLAIWWPVRRPTLAHSCSSRRIAFS